MSFFFSATGFFCALPVLLLCFPVAFIFNKIVGQNTFPQASIETFLVLLVWGFKSRLLLWNDLRNKLDKFVNPRHMGGGGGGVVSGDKKITTVYQQCSFACGTEWSI